MAVVTGLTAERMIEMENATVIGGHIDGEDLILETKDGTLINAGSVIGPRGDPGSAFIVCTSSTRPGSLGSGDEGLVIYETDTNLVRIWTGTRWKMQERVICTSSTRPSMVSADEGVKIYETDTNLEYVWSGSSWFPVSSSIATFADATERAANWPSPTSGAMSYLASSPGTQWIYENGVWNTVGPPPGTCMPWLGDTAPLHWVLMYGQTIANAQTLYPILWGNVSSTWKSGSSLVVPDVRGRVIAARDAMGGTAAGRFSQVPSNMGTGYGDQWTQSHNHGVSDPGHSHNVGETLDGPGPYGVTSGGKAISLSTGQSGTGLTVIAWGSGSGHNMQPTIFMNWILKIV